MSGQTNPEARAVFLAAIEYGVSPVLTGDLYRKTTPTPRPKRRHALRRRAATASPRPARSIVKSAADIMEEVNR